MSTLPQTVRAVGGSHCRRAAVLALTAGIVVLGSSRPAGAATTHNPFGYLDQLAATSSTSITVAGWAADPDALSQAVSVTATVDGLASGQVVTAVARPDVVRARGTGPTPGFGMKLTSKAGSHNVCVTARNLGSGADTRLGCRTVTVPASPTPGSAQSPIGTLDSASVQANLVTLLGWAADPDNLSQPLKITATSDGAAAAISTATVLARPDVAQAQHTGPNPGYSLKLSLTNGSHLVCTTAGNLAAGADRQLGCRTVWVGPPPLTAAQILAHSPSGALESAVAVGASGIQVTGWASDPDNTATASTVLAYLDGTRVASATAASSRPDLVLNPHAGYSFTVAGAAPGSHNLCLWAVNIGIGANRFLRCATLSTPALAMLPGPAPATPAVNQKVVQLATTFIGSRYVWGGVSPSTGFDCSGLVQYSYLTAAAITTPRVSRDQFRAARLISAARAVPGDLVFFHDNTGYVYHVGIYTGLGQMVAAVDPAHGVRAQSIWDSTATFGSFTHS